MGGEGTGRGFKKGKREQDDEERKRGGERERKGGAEERRREDQNRKEEGRGQAEVRRRRAEESKRVGDLDCSIEGIDGLRDVSEVPRHAGCSIPQADVLGVEQRGNDDAAEGV
eukprot:747990-Hanusia_phi.AAC.3